MAISRNLLGSFLRNPASATIPILRRLPRSARVAYPLINAGIREGMTIRGIARAIRSAGLPISESSISAIRPAVQASIDYSTSLLNRSKGYRIRATHLPVATGFQAANYNYVVKFERRRLDNNELEEGYITLTSELADQTVGGLEQKALEILRESPTFATYSEPVVHLHDATRRNILLGY